MSDPLVMYQELRIQDQKLHRNMHSGLTFATSDTGRAHVGRNGTKPNTSSCGWSCSSCCCPVTYCLGRLSGPSLLRPCKARLLIWVERVPGSLGGVWWNAPSYVEYWSCI